MLVNARHVKQVPGRKTDVSDAAWLCQLAEAGLLRASFVPPKPIRDLRLLTRYRRTQIAERKREAQRLHKALEDTGIKLDCVATDILGKSGRAMLDALISGTTDAELLADLARGKLRKRIPALREALQGRFEPVHALLVGSILSHLDFLDEHIAGLSEAIEEQIAPFRSARELLTSIPGVGQRTAEVIIAEIGTDMTAFPTAGHLASWAGQCPGNDQSAGRRRSGRTRNGSKWLDWALEEAGMATVRTKDVYLAAKYQRLRPRRGHKKALGAVKHSILCACWHMLDRRALPGPRRRLLPAPRPRTDHQAADRPARGARSSRHPGVGGGLRGIFLSVIRRRLRRWPVAGENVKIRGVDGRRRVCLGACEPVVQFDVGASPGSRACRRERVL